MIPIQDPTDLILTIGWWDIECLLKYESSAVFKDYIKKFDIFGFCETWSKCISEFDSFISGYKSFIFQQST